ncbi:MAG: DUF1501 domain-containing protein [Thermoanaerobaculia bacterium]|nr:DUF1501 domain-containing protein [Thermoanaerobaculia bacterium]
MGQVHAPQPTGPNTPKVHVSGDGDQEKTLVVIFLRGGADGLTLVPPVADDGYHRARPLLGIDTNEGHRLDDLFALHPHLGALRPLFDEGRFGVIHAAGSDDHTRSHFSAQDLMEHGGEGVGGGWLGRYLRYGAGQDAGGGVQASALSAVALGKTLPESLRSAPSAVVMEDFDSLALGQDSYATALLLHEIELLYGLETGELGHASRSAVSALRRIEDLRGRPYVPSGGAEYPKGEFGRGLREIARMIKARVGLEAATLDLNGWDSHLTQSALLAPLLRNLGDGLAAFADDLGPQLATTQVVVMTEFGRRVHENASFGTDHGRGSVMLTLGGACDALPSLGGHVTADWPGLDGSVLEGPGDLPVVHDYRDVLTPILHWHSGSTDDAPLPRVFPDHDPQPVWRRRHSPS